MSLVKEYIRNQLIGKTTEPGKAIVGSGSPLGIIIPRDNGELYFDSSAHELWVAVGTTITSWIKVRGTGGMDISRLSSGILGACNIDGITNAVDTNCILYTAPVHLYPREITITVCNRNTKSVMICLAHYDGLADNEAYLLYNVKFHSNETKIIDIDGMEPLEVLMIRSDSAHVSCIVSGTVYGSACKGTKIGALNPPAATLMSLVQTDETTSYEKVSVFVCNKSSHEPLSIRMAHSNSISIRDLTPRDYSIYGEIIYPTETRVFEHMCLVGTSSTLAVYSSSADADFIGYGTEI